MFNQKAVAAQLPSLLELTNIYSKTFVKNGHSLKDQNLLY